MNLKDASTLIITENYPPLIGGAALSARRNALFLATLLNEVQVFAFNDYLPEGQTEVKECEGITLNMLGRFNDESLTLQVCGNIISQLQEENKFSVLQGFYGLRAGYLAAFYGGLTGARSLVNMRGNDVDRGMFHRDHHSFLLWTLAHSDAVTCVTRELAGKCSLLSGRKDIDYVPNSVNTEIFCPQGKNMELIEKYNLGGRFILGFFGELRMKKGFTFIFDAIRELHSRIPLALLMIGDIRKSEKEYFLQYMEKCHHLRDRIIHLRYMPDPFELCQHYNLVDAVLSPSLWEGMPNVVLEAMACGKIVISSDAGGARDIIEHGESGFLIKTGELHGLKDMIQKVYALSSNERRSIEEKARRRVLTSFNHEREFEPLTAVYRRLVQ